MNNMPRMIIRRQQAASHSLPDSMHPVMRRIYAARNISSAAQLDTSLGGLLSYQSLSGIDAAVSLLLNAMNNNNRIVIVADYDADGATGCALAMRGLRAMGASDLHYIVPSRFQFGYGLGPEIVEIAVSMGAQLLITVDNGISSVSGVAAARDMGIDVLITDHHLAAAQLPDANVILNPNQPGDNFQSKYIAGVGVVFYLLAALRARLRDQDWFRMQNLPEPNLAGMLDLVALGTVADVVPLDFNNRILVAQGLARIRSGACIPGIRALLTVAKRRYDRVTAGDLGFAVGPRLNAAGRLEDMSLGIECLLCDDERQARQLAIRLDELNQERKEIQQDMNDVAEHETDILAEQGDLPYGLSLYKEDWHQGVVGILASRIREKWNRPVIAFANDRDGLIKGSARSVKNLHIRDLLESIAAESPGLITSFGGHAMAAGLSIHRSRFKEFSLKFDELVRRRLTEDDLRGDILTDGSLSESDISLTLAREVVAGGPWGQEFPEPLFDGVFDIHDRRIVGEKHLKLRLAPTGTGKTFDAIAFFTTEDDLPREAGQVEVAYRLDVNEYFASPGVQMIIEHIRPSA